MKQTKSEKGSVTTTKPQEMAVRSQPQRPIPLSDSSAGKERERGKKGLLLVCCQVLFSLSFLSDWVYGTEKVKKKREKRPATDW